VSDTLGGAFAVYRVGTGAVHRTANSQIGVFPGYSDVGGSRSGSVKLHDRLERGRVRSQPEARFGYISGMIETAENLARDYGISRQEADEYAVRSHRRAADAWASGRFDDEIVPVNVPQRKGGPVLFTCDEGVRALHGAGVSRRDDRDRNVARR
jgi:acetyl-CoA acetyltransferase